TVGISWQLPFPAKAMNDQLYASRVPPRNDSGLGYSPLRLAAASPAPGAEQEKRNYCLQSPAARPPRPRGHQLCQEPRAAERHPGGGGEVREHEAQANVGLVVGVARLRGTVEHAELFVAPHDRQIKRRADPYRRKDLPEQMVLVGVGQH